VKTGHPAAAIKACEDPEAAVTARLRAWAAISLSLLGLTTAAVSSGPALALEHDEVNLGHLESGEIGQATLRFRNVSGRTLSISGVRASCRCISGETDRKTYIPGAEGLLKISGSAGKPGRYEYWIIIQSDEKEIASAKVRYDVTANYAIVPRIVNFDLRELLLGRTVVNRIEILYHGAPSSRLKVLSAKASHAAFGLEVAKHDWLAEEIPLGDDDPGLRPPLGVVLVSLGPGTPEEVLTQKQHSLLLTLGNAETSRVFVVSILIRPTSIYRIYPRPLVRALSHKDRDSEWVDEILIESLTEGLEVTDALVMEDRHDSPVAEVSVSRCSKGYVAKVKWDKHFPPPPGQNPKWNGEIVLGVCIGGKVFKERIPYLLRWLD
jgi:hypothetical protein